jgi:hypothetical protein
LICRETIRARSRSNEFSLVAAGQARERRSHDLRKADSSAAANRVLKEMLRMYRDFMKTAKRATPHEAHSVELIELILSERPDEPPNGKERP